MPCSICSTSNGIDIADAPLLERKELLQELLEGDLGHLAYSSHIEGDGDSAYQLAGERHFEGLISKRADRAYHGGRSEDWKKSTRMSFSARSTTAM